MWSLWARVFEERELGTAVQESPFWHRSARASMNEAAVEPLPRPTIIPSSTRRAALFPTTCFAKERSIFWSLQGNALFGTVSHMKNIVKELLERGFIDQITSEDLLQKKELSLYIGFDPTSDSLHLGNLVGIVALSWFHRAGHTVYPLLGGATGLVGDPSGKSTERPLLDEAILRENVASLSEFFDQVLPGAKVLNNYDWLGSFSFLSFLRDVGKFFRIGPMLGKEMVRTRLQSEEGMSFTEFSYQLLQAYDFYYLHDAYGVTVQMGGSDQWGNITAGIDFNRRMGKDSIYGATFPLLTRSDGKKFGKSEEGAIWLSKKKLSVFDFYQYLYRVPDADVIRLLKMLTFLPLEEIREIEETKETQFAQRRLAEEVTRFVHGEEGLRAALDATQNMYQEESLTGGTFVRLLQTIPPSVLSYDEVVGRKFVEVAVLVGLVSSKSEGVKLIRNQGAYFNQEKVLEEGKVIEASDLIDGKYCLLASGKKKQRIVQIRS